MVVESPSFLQSQSTPSLVYCIKHTMSTPPNPLKPDEKLAILPYIMTYLAAESRKEKGAIIIKAWEKLVESGKATSNFTPKEFQKVRFNCFSEVFHGLTSHSENREFLVQLR